MNRLTGKNIHVAVGGDEIANAVVYCDDMASRRKGLLGRSALSGDEGVLMTMSSLRQWGFFGLLTSIHMIGMTFPIAVAWLSVDGTVVHSVYAKPGVPYYGTWRPAAYVLEVHPDHLARLARGVKVTWVVVEA